MSEQINADYTIKINKHVNSFYDVIQVLSTELNKAYRFFYSIPVGLWCKESKSPITAKAKKLNISRFHFHKLLHIFDAVDSENRQAQPDEHGTACLFSPSTDEVKSIKRKEEATHQKINKVAS